jgi:hypothetical protein
MVTRFYCPEADTSLRGALCRGAEPPFGQLTPEQLKFVEVFVRNEGKLNRLEDELGLSYPTIRSRLHDDDPRCWATNRARRKRRLCRRRPLSSTASRCWPTWTPGVLSFDAAMQKFTGRQLMSGSNSSQYRLARRRSIRLRRSIEAI